MKLSVTDEAGNQVALVGNSVAGNDFKYINKPSANVGICNYIFTLEPTSYDNNFNSYRVMVGNKTDGEAIMSGRENAVRLERYDENSSQYLTRYTPNMDESWFRITALDSPTVFTILNHHPQIRFKILDIDDLYVLFDSNSTYNDDVHKTQYIGPFSGAEKARLNTTIGKEYYMVIYSPSPISSLTTLLESSLNISVGRPNMTRDSSNTYYSNSTVTGTTSSFSSSAIVNVSSDIPSTAVVDKVRIGGASIFEIDEWKVRAPFKTNWKKTNKPFEMYIDYDYVENSNLNVMVPGNWSVAFKGAKGNLSMKPGLSFSYYYELGD